MSNIKIPEEKGEVSDLDTWPANTFQSRRAGTVAYDTAGNVVPNARPVFVSREECIKRDLNPEDPLREMLTAMHDQGK